MFGISIYKQPEHFIALYIGLFTNKNKGVAQMANILTRTKNPPISAIYTQQLLKQKAWQEYGLDIIRFLSQLSDLSDGGSMSSSLQSVIGESSFLTQIRHNLTHKIKISDYLIQISRNIILKQLKQKYWDYMYQRLTESYGVSMEKISHHYKRIYQQQLNQLQIQNINKSLRKLDRQWLTKHSTNYQFKQFFPSFYNQQNIQKVHQLINQLQSHKKAIGLSFLIRKFCQQNKNQKLSQLLIKIFRSSHLNLFKQKLVTINLRKLTFIHYLGLCQKVIKSLPPEIIDQLQKYWSNRQSNFQKQQKNFTIYKIFKKQLLP